jgi:hypothetical protein
MAQKIVEDSQRPRHQKGGNADSEAEGEIIPCAILKMWKVDRVLGGTAGRRGFRRGGLYFFSRESDFVRSAGLNHGIRPQAGYAQDAAPLILPRWLFQQIFPLTVES